MQNLNFKCSDFFKIIVLNIMMRFITKRTTVAVMLYLAGIASVFAQQGELKVRQDGWKDRVASRWYVSASLGDQWMFNGTGITGLLRLNGGTWFNDFWGIRLSTQGSKMYRNMGSSAWNWQTSLNATLNMLPVLGEYDARNPFFFNVSAGLGYNLLRYPSDDCVNTHTISLNVGAQAGYDFNAHWGAFVDLGGYLLPKYYKGTGRMPVVLAGDWSIGLRYKFSTHVYGNSRVDELERRVEELNELVNMLRERVQNKDNAVAETSRIMLAPKNEEAAVEIYFDEFSAYLGDEQLDKMNVIGDWMRVNENFSIRVIVFADNARNAEIGERVRKERMEVIKSVMVKKYGVEPNRIELIKAETLGYENLTGCNARIVFVNK